MNVASPSPGPGPRAPTAGARCRSVRCTGIFSRNNGGGFIDLRVDPIQGGMEACGVGENAIFMPGRVEPQFGEWLAFSGTSVMLGGEQP